VKNQKQLIQLATLFHTFKHDQPMLVLKVHKELFDFLSLEENPKMNWIDSVGNWAMAQHMHDIVLEVTKYVIGVAQFISLTCDEVSTIDNQNMFMWFKIGYKY
jgi:hypothetical protein